MVDHTQLAEHVFSDRKINNVIHHLGNRHTTLEVELEGEESKIIRYLGKESFNPDMTYFGAKIDLDQEAYVATSLHDVIGNIAPEVIGEGTYNEGEYLVLTRLEGDEYRTVRPQISIEEGKEVIHSLGEILGEIRDRVQFDTYGNFGDDQDSFGSFWAKVMNKRLQHPNMEKAFYPKEIEEVKNFIGEKTYHNSVEGNASLVIYDLHDKNFLVKDGKVSGLYDFDFSTRGHASMEAIPVMLSIVEAPYKDGARDRKGLFEAFEKGFGQPFNHDVLEMTWANTCLYQTLLHCLGDGPKPRPGFPEIFKHRLFETIRAKEVDTSKFFEIHPDNSSSILEPYQATVEGVRMPHKDGK